MIHTSLDLVLDTPPCSFLDVIIAPPEQEKSNIHLAGWQSLFPRLTAMLFRHMAESDYRQMTDRYSTGH